MKKVIHVITGLGDGGAEGVLYRLCTTPSQSDWQHEVIALTGDERYRKYEPLLKEQGICVVNLNMPSGKVTMAGLVTLFKLLRAKKPDVVQCWLYHADLVGGVIARLAGVKRVYWGIRHSDFQADKTSRAMRIIVKLCSKLSGLVPHKIVCCAERAKLVHEQIGYKGDMVVVQNGYDLNKFTPNRGARTQLLNELAIDENACLMGMVARYNPQKNHIQLVEAFNSTLKYCPKARLLLVGYGVDDENKQLCELIKRNRLEGRVFLLGQRADIPAFMSALDIHVLASSFGEGFPNVVAESMSCGTPNVVTDIGDAAVIVGDTGWVADSSASTDLASALTVAVTAFDDDKSGWAERTQLCRARISDNFSLQQMVSKFEAQWDAPLNK